MYIQRTPCLHSVQSVRVCTTHAKTLGMNDAGSLVSRAPVQDWNNLLGVRLIKSGYWTRLVNVPCTCTRLHDTTRALKSLQVLRDWNSCGGRAGPCRAQSYNQLTEGGGDHCNLPLNSLQATAKLFSYTNLPVQKWLKMMTTKIFGQIKTTEANFPWMAVSDHPGLSRAALLQPGFDASFSNPRDSFCFIFQWNFT